MTSTGVLRLYVLFRCQVVIGKCVHTLVKPGSLVLRNPDSVFSPAFFVRLPYLNAKTKTLRPFSKVQHVAKESMYWVVEISKITNIHH